MAPVTSTDTPPVPPTGEPLIGTMVRLDPTVPADADGLLAVYGDPAAYEQGYAMDRRHTSLDQTRQAVAEAVAARAADGTGRTAYTVRLVADSELGAAGTVVGTSSLGDVDLVREHVHLGWTFYGSRWWGTSVNPEAKLLLLTHAFDTCGFGRVRIQTDVINARSRAAISRLGATFEGITRRDSRRADGTWRDSAVFSVLVDEWPAVRDGLLARLEGAPARDAGREG
ncbi:GNAT family N-acetyltransferase [Ornithinimicrobium cavernae]|uniref:GNAT family N-acetyltransferase n=1 Tax=Ornithinimicrobium cavernae TaxID=2666047 RepID=UPI000D697CD6|nr:GNAT family protein [Ornithinimicrobium cavernae]